MDDMKMKNPNCEDCGDQISDQAIATYRSIAAYHINSQLDDVFPKICSRCTLIAITTALNDDLAMEQWMGKDLSPRKIK